MKKFLPLLFFFLFGTVLNAQSLDFLGLTGISYGMHLDSLKDRQLIMDTTSSYTDTALYLKQTRCQMYYRPNENLQLKGFNARHVEYEFCDNELGYVFVYVSGKTEISNALAALKVNFPKMNCGKNVPLGTCSLIDTHNNRLRLIVRVNQVTNEMNFVLIPRKAAR
ncbi:MAG TPA: hypothetical protein VK826_04135 [Bacteroidia bacterium]|nr:hypothetical protein [Bacteroidia bacterium]